MVAIGIDVGGTSIKGAIINEKREIIDRFSMPTDLKGDPNIEAGKLCELINETIANSKYKNEVVGIGIGVPGHYDDNGYVINCTNLVTWNNFKLVEFVEKRTNLPVKLINDADAAALAEAKFGKGKNDNFVLAITLGTGVGGGVVINKQVYTGYKYTGGELGHMVIRVGGRPCMCGRQGCFETYASATALIRDTKEVMKVNKSTLMHSIYNELGTIDARLPFIAESRGDEAAKKIIDEYVVNLSEALLNLCNIFRPNIIVLSGGVANEGENLLSRIREYVKKYEYGMHDMPEIRIECSQLGYDAGKIGAASLFL